MMNLVLIQHKEGFFMVKNIIHKRAYVHRRNQRRTDSLRQFLGLLNITAPNTLGKIGQIISAGKMDKLLQRLFADTGFLSLQLGNDSIDDIRFFIVAFGLKQPVQQILKGRIRRCYDWLHIGDVFKRFIHAHRIVNLKMSFPDGWAEPRSTAQHLLKENAGLDPAHENKRGDFRHVNTGRQEIDGDNDFRIRFILESLDRLRNFLPVTAGDTSGDFHHCVVVDTVF